MRGLLTKLSLLITTLTFVVAAKADVTVLATVVEGEARRVGDVVNVVNPRVQINGVKYILYTGNSTADAACKLMGMSYVNHYASNIFESRDRLRIADTGAMQIIANDIRAIQILSCK